MAYLGERKDDGYFESPTHSTMMQQISGVNAWDDKWTAEQKLDGTYNRFPSDMPQGGSVGGLDIAWWERVVEFVSDVKSDLAIIWSGRGGAGVIKRIWTLVKFPVVHSYMGIILAGTSVLAAAWFGIRIVLQLVSALVILGFMAYFFGLWDGDVYKLIESGVHSLINILE